MSSLHQDPSSLLSLPITVERIILTIRNPLQRLHQQGIPSWYEEIESAMEKLVRLGTKISAYPQAVEAHDKLHALANAVQPLEIIYSIINDQLIRNVQNVANQRCDNGHLSLFLALMDGWLRSCEEYVRRLRSPRFADDISGFEDAYRELIAVSTPYMPDQSFKIDHILYLFDSLGLTKS